MVRTFCRNVQAAGELAAASLTEERAHKNQVIKRSLFFDKNKKF